MSSLHPHQEHGFTLIELLVSMLTATVVIGALFEIFIVSLHQTSRITDSVQATQLGRTAMTHVVDELHSACLAREFKPVQENSGETELIFKNAYSAEALLPNTKAAEEKSKPGTGVFEHQIVWNSTAKTLTDFVYKSTSGEGSGATLPTPDYFSTTHEAANAEPKKGILLASNVTETGSTPIFKYYAYGEEYSSSTSEPVSTLTEMTPSTGMKAGEANSVAAVLVSFTTAPIDKQTALSRSAAFSNQVTFAFGAPSSEAKIADGPCE